MGAFSRCSSGLEESRGRVGHREYHAARCAAARCRPLPSSAAILRSGAGQVELSLPPAESRSSNCSCDCCLLGRRLLSTTLYHPALAEQVALCLSTITLARSCAPHTTPSRSPPARSPVHVTRGRSSETFPAQLPRLNRLTSSSPLRTGNKSLYAPAAAAPATATPATPVCPPEPDEPCRTVKSTTYSCNTRHAQDLTTGLPLLRPAPLVFFAPSQRVLY
eukprot:COSAG06_NODE_3912_length_4778_cov_545.291302_3_plen_220_part_00